MSGRGPDSDNAAVNQNRAVLISVAGMFDRQVLRLGSLTGLPTDVLPYVAQSKGAGSMRSASRMRMGVKAL